jgi:hypothetical protein
MGGKLSHDISKRTDVAQSVFRTRVVGSGVKRTNA